MAVVMDLNFNPANYPIALSSGSADPIAEAKKWWSILAGGYIDDTLGSLSLSNLAHPLFVSNGALSHLRFEWAQTAIEVQGAYREQSLLYADLSPPDGSLVNCTDPDSTKRGRYLKIGAPGAGSWSKVSSTIADKGWGDPNHKERLLELLFCSWIKTTPPHPGSGVQQAIVSPPAQDWRNAQITLRLRARDLYLGMHAKIVPHIQGDIAAATARLPKYIDFVGQPAVNSTITVAGTVFTFKASGAIGNQINIGGSLSATITNIVNVLTASVITGVKLAAYSGTATRLTATPDNPNSASYSLLADAPSQGIATGVNATPNFINTANIISDGLGFARSNSWGLPNDVPYVEDSGIKDIVIQFTPDDDDWECLGTIDRPLSFFHYISVKIADLLTSVIGNSYIMVVHPKPQPDGLVYVAVPNTIPENERIRGVIEFYGYKVEV